MLPRILPMLDRAIEIAACILVAALLGCVTLGVIMRSLNDPLIWTDEIARFIMIWLAVFGWILASRRRTHVRIRFFQDLLPPAAWKVAETIIQVALLAFGIGIAVYSVGLTLRNLDLEATTVPISMAWMYLPMVLAGGVTAMQALIEIIEIRKRPRDPSPLGESVIE